MFLQVDIRHDTGAARIALRNKRPTQVKRKVQSIVIHWECIATAAKVVSGSHVMKSMTLPQGKSLFICNITKYTHHTMMLQCCQKPQPYYEKTLNGRHQMHWYPKSNHFFLQSQVHRYTVPRPRWVRSCGRGMTYNCSQQRPYCMNTQGRWMYLTCQK